VRELQNLNQINNDLPQVPIEDIIKNPEQYALDFYETMFTRHLGRFMLAYRLGEEFATKNKGVIKKGKKRYYLDGEEIDKKLPAKYQYGTMLDEKPSLCGNCKFYVKTNTGDEYCAQWDANVRKDYWCKKWQKNHSK
jgi:hypothetical protein